MLSSQFPFPSPHFTMSKTITNAALLLSVAIVQLTIGPSKSNAKIKRATDALSSSSSSSEEIGVAVFNTHEPTRYSWNPHPNSVHFIPLTSPEGKHELLQLERRPQVRKLYSDTLVAGIFDETYESGNHGKSKDTSKMREQVRSNLSTSTKAWTSAKPNLKASVNESHQKGQDEIPITHYIQKSTVAPLARSVLENNLNLLITTPSISELASPLPSNEDTKQNISMPAESRPPQMHHGLDTAQQSINSKNGSFLKLKQILLATASEPTTSHGQLKELEAKDDGPSEKPDEDSKQLSSSEESYKGETRNLPLPEPLSVSSSTSAETATDRHAALQTDFQNLEEVKGNINATISVDSFQTSVELAINQTNLNINEFMMPPPNPVDYYSSQQTQNAEDSTTSIPKYNQQYPRLPLQGRSIVPFKFQATNSSSRLQNTQKQMTMKNEKNQVGTKRIHSGQIEHLAVEGQTGSEGQGSPETEKTSHRSAKINGRRVAPSGRRVTPAGRSVARARKQNVADPIKSITDSDSSDAPADNPKHANKFTSLTNSPESRTKPTDDSFKYREVNSERNLFNSNHSLEDEPVESSTEHTRETGGEHEENEGQAARTNSDQSRPRTAKISGRKVAPSVRRVTPSARSVARGRKQNGADQIKSITDSDSSVAPANHPKYSNKFTSLKNSPESSTKQTDDGFKNEEENSRSHLFNSKHLLEDKRVQSSIENTRETGDEHEENEGRGTLGNSDQSNQRTAKITGRRVVQSGRRVLPHGSPLRITTQPLEDLDISTSIVIITTEDPAKFRELSSFSTSKQKIANGGFVLPAPLLVPQDHENLKNESFNEILHPKGNDNDSVAFSATDRLHNFNFNANKFEGSTTELHAVAEAFKLTTAEPTAFTSAPLADTANLQAFPLVRSYLTLLPTPTKAPRRHSISFGRSVKGLLDTLRSALNVPASKSLHSAEITEPTSINQTMAAAQNKSVAVHIKSTDGTHVIVRANFTSFSAQNTSTNELKRKIMPNVSPESLANLSVAIQDLVQAIKKHNFHHGKHGASHNKDSIVQKPPETVQNPTNFSTGPKDINPGGPEEVLIHIRAPDGTTFDLQANSSSSLWKEFQEMAKVVKFWHENQHDMNHKWNETDTHPLLPQPEQLQPSLAGIIPVNVGINQIGQTFVLDINSEHQATSPETVVQNNQLNAAKKETLIARPTKKQRKAKNRRKKLKSYKRFHKKFRKDPLLLPAIEFALQDAIRRYQRSKGRFSKFSRSYEYDEQLDVPSLKESKGRTKPKITVNAHDPVINLFSQSHPNIQQNIQKQMRLKNDRNQFDINQKHSGRSGHLGAEGQTESEEQGRPEMPEKSCHRSAKINGRRVVPFSRRVTPTGRNVARASKQTAADQIKPFTDSDSSDGAADEPQYANKFTSLKNSLGSTAKQTDDGFKNGEVNSQNNLFNGKHTLGENLVRPSIERMRETGRSRKLNPAVPRKGKSKGDMRGRAIFPSTSKSNRRRIDLENEIQESNHDANSPAFESDRSVHDMRAESLNEMTSAGAKADDETLVYKETFNHHKPDILPTTLTKYPSLMKGVHVYPAAGLITRTPNVKSSKKFISQPKVTQARGRAAAGTQSQDHSSPPHPEKFTLHDILIRAYKNGRIKP